MRLHPLKRSLAWCSLIVLFLLCLVGLFFVSPVVAAFLLMLPMQLGVSFAIVGKGNRWAWLVLMPIVWSVVIGFPMYLLADFGDIESSANVLLKLLYFTYLPIAMGLFYTAAHQFRLYRAS